MVFNSEFIFTTHPGRDEKIKGRMPPPLTYYYA
jgi:hypothetical protein